MLSLSVYFGFDAYNASGTTNSGSFTKIVFEKIMFVINITTSHGNFQYIIIETLKWNIEV